ncbi:MAG TPA: hypothetical protein VGE72_31420 [Azospirillum sp.]
MGRRDDDMDESAKTPRDRFTGTPADRLVRLWRAEDPRFDELLDELLDNGRQAVIDVAVQKLRDDEQMTFMDDVESLSEMVDRVDDAGERTATSLYWFVAEVTDEAESVPPVHLLEEAFTGAGLLAEGEKLRLLPVWLDPEPLSYLDPSDRRALLRRILASFDGAADYLEDQELTADPADGAGLLAFVGLFDQRLPDEREGDEPEDAVDEEAEAAEDARLLAALDVFSAAVADAYGPISRCRPVGGLTDLLDFVAEEPWDDTAVLGDLGRFVDVASAEVEDGVIDAAVSWTPGVLEVGLSAADGRWLDSATFEVSEEQLTPAMEVLKRRCRTVRPAAKG